MLRSPCKGIHGMISKSTFTLNGNAAKVQEFKLIRSEPAAIPPKIPDHI